MISIEEKAREIGIDEGLVLELFLEFVEHSNKDVAELKDCLSKGDHNAVLQIAHSIKGAAANLRAYEIAALAKEIEDLGRNDNFSEVKALLGDLEAHIEKLRTQLDSVPEP
jgi:HPt (histidine-containing phosphotransfer) domain-containing protein